ncbi:MAG: TonB-dependent receptor [Bacteroidota bacterium]
MNFKLILILAFNLLIGQSFAQGLEGTIKAADGSGIAYATITVLNTNQGTVSDANGNFYLNMPSGTYQLEIRAIGYATAIEEVDLSSDQQFDFTLAEKAETLDQVTVTAQKTEQEILEVPISVTAISEEKVKNAQVWTLENLNSIVPNFYSSEARIGFQQIHGIRGIQVFSENPAIATYIDGVNNLDILANGFLLTDIERIEVLRGPQGTLFGRNAMGGVINIVTRQPNNQHAYFVESSVGNLGLRRHGFGAKLPVIPDKLFLGFTGQYQSRNGYLTADTTNTPAPTAEAQGARIGDEESFYGNLFLKWLVNGQLDLTFNIKGQIDQSDASGFFITQQLDRAINNPDRVGLGYVGDHRRDIINTSLAINYALPGFNLSSVSTYQAIGLSYENVSWPYFFGGAGSLYSSYRDGQFGVRGEPQEVFTQEFKINSTNEQSPIHYTAGLFGFRQDAFEPTTNLGSEILSGPFAGPTFVSVNEGTNEGLAAFGQLTYRLGDQWEVIAGLRYDYERRENFFNDGGLTFVGSEQVAAGTDTTVTGEYNALSPKLAVTYKTSPSSNLYASYTRGFRAGGINTQLIQNADLTFDPEFSDNYEVGFKSELLDNRLRLSVAAYHIQWSAIQFFSQVAGGIYIRDNLGDAATTGLEIEITAIPVKNLNVDIAYGTNFNSEYQDFALQGRFATEPLNLDGNTLANTPKSTLFIAPQYTLPINANVNLIGRLEYRGVGEHFTDVENNIRVDSYQTFNGRVGVAYKKFDLFFWMNNIGDERFISFGSPSTIDAFSPADFRVLMSPPRTYGVTFSARF